MKEERTKSLAALIETEALLEKSTMDTGTASIDMQQWQSIIINYKNINAHLTLLSLHDKEAYVDNLSDYIANYKGLENEVSLLFKA